MLSNAYKKVAVPVLFILLDNKGGNSQTFEVTLLVDIFIMLSSYTKINDTNDFYNPQIIRRKQY